MKPTSTIPSITLLKRLDCLSLNQADRQFVTGCLLLTDDARGFSRVQRGIIEKIAKAYGIDMSESASPLGVIDFGPMVKIPPPHKPAFVARAEAAELRGGA
jgi:hypothetical protein